MFKKIVPFIVVLIFVSCQNEVQNDNDNNKQSQINPKEIKKLEKPDDFAYKHSIGKIIRKEYPARDSSGAIVRDLKSNGVYSTLISHFDNEGYKIKTELSYQGSDFEIREYEYFQDKSLKKVSIDKKSNIIYSHSKGYYETVALSIDSLGVEFKKEVIKRNKDQKVVEINIYDSNGVLSEKTIFNYSDNLLISKKTFGISSNEIKDSTVYLYDNHGNISNFKIYKSDYNSIQEAEYNIDGDLITSYSKMKFKSLYNEKEIQSISTYKYFDYDKKGNWTKMIIYNNTLPEGIVEREIVYF